MIWNLVSDSSCDLLTSSLDTPNIHFHSVPMQIQVGDQAFVDDQNLSVPELLGAMKEERSASSTACPSPAAFARVFEQADYTICFTISGALSGTHNAACMGRDLVLEEHPEKKIVVIDSKSTAGALVLLVRRAKALIEADETENFDAICDALRTYQASLRICFTLECFDNLIKNGRMHPLVGNLLKTLGIHVIGEATPQGTIQVADKARGETKTYQAMTKLMGSSKDCTGAHVMISHCENLSGAMKLKEQILKDLPVAEVELLSCRGLTSYYAMQKGLIVAY